VLGRIADRSEREPRPLDVRPVLMLRGDDDLVPRRDAGARERHERLHVP
jgi:hypothetical protein